MSHVYRARDTLIGRTWIASPAASCWWPRTTRRIAGWPNSSPAGVAKNDAAHHGLAEQFAGRQVSKTYLALVEGEVKAESGRIARPIARDPVHRTRMTARLSEGRAAWSEYRVLRRFTGFSLL